MINDVLFWVGGGCMVGLALVAPRPATLVAIFAIPLYLVQPQIGNLPINYWELLVCALGLGVMVQSEFRKSLAFPKLPIWGVWPIVIMGLGLLVGLVVAPDTIVALGIVKGWFVIPMLLALVVYNLYRLESPLPIIYSLLLSTLPLSALAAVQMMTQDFITIDSRASAWFVSANYLALFLVPILLLSLPHISRSPRPLLPLLVLSQVAGAVALWGTYSFGGWAAFVIGFVVLVTTIWRAKILFATAGGALLGLLAYLGNERLAAILNFSERSSGGVRIQVWQIAWHIVQQNIFTGAGLGSFKDLYTHTAPQLFSPPIEFLMLHPHNLVLSLLINTGLLGFMGFVGLVIQWWHRVMRILDRGYRGGLLAAMVAVLVHGLTDSTYFKNDLAAAFWIIVILAFIPHVQTKTSEKI